MNNIPENIIQAVADAAFEAVKATYLVTPKAGYDYADARRAIIQHALDNPALAPFLAGGIGEYMDEELLEASNKADRMRLTGFNWFRAFIDALRRRESPALAKATPPAEVAIIEEQAWVDPVCGCIRSPYAPKDSPCPICKPDALVPLGPEDYPPGSVLRFAEQHWYNALYVSREVICLISGDSVAWKDWNKLQDDGWQINTSLPDTGRWDKDAWRPCSKPGK
jgi:hypothetical protein